MFDLGPTGSHPNKENNATIERMTLLNRAANLIPFQFSPKPGFEHGFFG
jgi:hypothetical protein